MSNFITVTIMYGRQGTAAVSKKFILAKALIISLFEQEKGTTTITYSKSSTSTDVVVVKVSQSIDKILELLEPPTAPRQLQPT